MLKQFILFLLILVTNACSFDESAEAVNDRRVKYQVNTIMTNVELVVTYYVEHNTLKNVVVNKFPWEIETYISPYNEIGMSGYLRYKDESLPLHNYIDLKLMVDVGNSYLNRGDTILIGPLEASFTNDDLKKGTSFNIPLEPLE